MNQKELRKLNRAELQDIVTEQNIVIAKLQDRVEELELALRDRTIKIDEAGSIADAAVQINGVFEATQNAAKQYLDNIESLNKRCEAICAQRDQESIMICAQREEETKAKCHNLELRTKQKCENLEKTTEQKVNARWAEFSQKVEQCLDAHGELKEILKFAVPDTADK